MNYKYLVLLMFCFVLSCNKKLNNEVDDSRLSTSKLERTKDSLRVYKNLDTISSKNGEFVESQDEDFFKKMESKLVPDYKLQTIITSENEFQQTLDKFILRDEIIFKNLKLEREGVLSIKGEEFLIFIREWKFESEKLLSIISKKIENRIYIDKKNGVKREVIKEPHFIIRNDLSLYLFYVKAEYQRKYLIDVERIMKK